MTGTYSQQYPTLYDNDRVEEVSAEEVDGQTTDVEEVDDAPESAVDHTGGDVEEVDRVEVDAVFETAVDSTLAAVRLSLLTKVSDKKVRKAIPILQTERRKVRRRNVDTDVPVSDLTFDAVLDLLNKGTEINAASTRAAKNRTDRITLTAPTWWWSLVGLAADANDALPADVISTAISKHLR